MATYWISFRLKDDDGYEDAYEAFTDVMKKALDQSTWWFETTSFYIADSEISLDGLAMRVKRAIRLDRDLVVIGMPGFKAGRVIGKCSDQDIFTLVPFMKKV